MSEIASDVKLDLGPEEEEVEEEEEDEEEEEEDENEPELPKTNIVNNNKPVEKSPERKIEEEEIIKQKHKPVETEESQSSEKKQTREDRPNNKTKYTDFIEKNSPIKRRHPSENADKNRLIQNNKSEKPKSIFTHISEELLKDQNLKSSYDLLTNDQYLNRYYQKVTMKEKKYKNFEARNKEFVEKKHEKLNSKKQQKEQEIVEMQPKRKIPEEERRSNDDFIKDLYRYRTTVEQKNAMGVLKEKEREDKACRKVPEIDDNSRKIIEDSKKKTTYKNVFDKLYKMDKTKKKLQKEIDSNKSFRPPNTSRSSKSITGFSVGVKSEISKRTLTHEQIEDLCSKLSKNKEIPYDPNPYPESEMKLSTNKKLDSTERVLIERLFNDFCQYRSEFLESGNFNHMNEENFTDCLKIMNFVLFENDEEIGRSMWKVLIELQFNKDKPEEVKTEEDDEQRHVIIDKINDEADYRESNEDEKESGIKEESDNENNDSKLRSEKDEVNEDTQDKGKTLSSSLLFSMLCLLMNIHKPDDYFFQEKLREIIQENDDVQSMETNETKNYKALIKQNKEITLKFSNHKEYKLNRNAYRALKLNRLNSQLDQRKEKKIAELKQQEESENTRPWSPNQSLVATARNKAISRLEKENDNRTISPREMPITEVYEILRKKKELEIAKLQRENEEQSYKECTFKPEINKNYYNRNSNMIVNSEEAENIFDKLYRQSHKRKEIQREVEYAKIQEEESMIDNLSFRPNLVSKYNTLHYEPSGLLEDKFVKKKIERMHKAMAEKKLCQLQKEKGYTNLRNIKDLDEILDEKEVKNFNCSQEAKSFKNTLQKYYNLTMSNSSIRNKSNDKKN